MNLKSILLGVLILLGFSPVMAQPGGNLGQIELKVTEKFRAEVGESRKIMDVPNFSDTTTAKLELSYRIVSQPIEVKFTPSPISPARIARVPVEDISQGMLRLGFGLYVTPLAEGYWNSARSSQKSYGFWGRHYSTIEGAERIFSNNAMAENELGAYFNRFYKDFTWSTQVSGSWDKFSYYGIDDFPDSDSLDFASFEEDPEKPLSNWYRHYQIESSITGNDTEDLGLLDEARLQFYNFSDAFEASENRFQLFSTWQLPTGGTPLDLELNLSSLSTSFNREALGMESSFLGGQFDAVYPENQSHFTVQARPSIDLVLSKLFFRFGINLYGNSYQSDITDGDFSLYFFPEVQVYVPFVEDVLSIYGGIKGELSQNSYRGLTNDNPYVNPAFVSNPTRNTDIFVGFEGLLSATTSFNLRGGIMLQKDLALYYRDPFYQSNYFIDSLMRIPALDVIYDNSETYYARGELSVNIDNNLQANIYGELRSYNMSSLEDAWHLPSFLAGLNFNYTYKEKLKLGTNWNYVGQRTAFSQDIQPDISAELPGYLDLGLNVEYLYNSRLSGFINFSNVLNQQYDLYLGYKAQRINFLMGFAYKL